MSKPEYQVLYGESFGELEQLVAECIDAGWLPQGGVAATITEDAFWAYQAMIRVKALDE